MSISRHTLAVRRRGHTLVQVAVSTLLVGALLTAALTTGQSLLARRKAADRIAARLLAEALLKEIMLKSYREAGGGTSPLGLDAGEAGAHRLAFDDVDDYHGHSDSPPLSNAGVPLPGYTGWTRSASVAWVHPTTLAPTGVDLGAKRITVSVSLDSTTLCTLTSFKTSAP